MKRLLLIFLLLPGVAQAQRMSLDEFLTEAGSRAWEEESQLRGAEAGFAEMDRRIIELWEECDFRPTQIPLDAHNIIRYRFIFERWVQGKTLDDAVVVWDSMFGPCAPILPPPILSNVFPRNGPIAGGTVVQLDGANFEPGPLVLFGDVFATNVNFISSTIVTAMTPPHGVGFVDVSITNHDAKSDSIPAAFEFFDPTPQPERGFRRGLVRAAPNGMIQDDDGIFNALGATFMAAVHLERTNPTRFDSELAYLRSASNGAVDYIRILATLGGDCDDYWGDITWDPEAPDFEDRIAATIDRAYDQHGMRTEVTVFGGDCYDDDRRETIDKVLRVTEHPDRVHKVIHMELTNEGWQTEYDRLYTSMQLDAEYLASRSQHLTAITSPRGDSCEGGPDGWEETYGNSPSVDLFTVHHDRNTGMGDGVWRTVRQPWDVQFCGLPAVSSSNEPIGPGSSVDTTSDPVVLVTSAINAYISGQSFYVFHSSAGVRNRVSFSQLPNADAIFRAYDAMKDYVPDELVGWEAQNSLWDGHPFEPIPNWVEEGGAGAVRAYAGTSGNEFFVLPIGINGHVDIIPKRDVTLQFFEVDTGIGLHSQDLDAGVTFRIDGSRDAMLVTGTYR